MEDKNIQKQDKKICFMSPGLEQRVNELRKKIGPPPPTLISVDHGVSRRESVPKTFKSPYLTSVFPKALG